MKHLSHYSLEEFEELYSDLPYDIVKIVYDYYHRDKNYTVSAFADKNGISTATLYRYIKMIERHN